jgi:hypothetical protein
MPQFTMLLLWTPPRHSNQQGLSDDTNKPIATVKCSRSSKDHVSQAEMNPTNNCHDELIISDLVAIRYLFLVLQTQTNGVNTQNSLLQERVDDLVNQHTKYQSTAVSMQVFNSQVVLNAATEENKPSLPARHRIIMTIQTLPDKEIIIAHKAELQARADRITAEGMF